MTEPSKAARDAAARICYSQGLHGGTEFVGGEDGMAQEIQRAIDAAVSEMQERCAVIAENQDLSWKIVAEIRALPQVPDED